MMEKSTMLLVGSSLAFLSACAGNAGTDYYDAMIEGPKTAGYQSDLEACHQVAEEWYYQEADFEDEGHGENAVSGVALGAALGAALGPGVGAALGAAIDAQNGVYTEEEYYAEYEYYAVLECMEERGYQVASTS